MKAFAFIALAATLAAVAAPASAQFAKPEDAIKYRQSALSVMGTHFGRVGAMTSGRVPFDAKAAAENTEIVANMAKLPWAAFGAGTDKGSIPTRVKPEIWTDAAKFKEAGDKRLAKPVTWTPSKPHLQPPPAPARPATTLSGKNKLTPV